MISTQINQEKYNAFQSYMVLQIPENFDFMAKDNIFYKVLEIVEGVKLIYIINFNKFRGDGYDTLPLLTALILSITIHRKLVSLRNLEKECKYDIRFQAIRNHETPCYKRFERLINNDLSLILEELLKKINFIYNGSHTYMQKCIVH